MLTVLVAILAIFLSTFLLKIVLNNYDKTHLLLLGMELTLLGGILLINYNIKPYAIEEIKYLWEFIIFFGVSIFAGAFIKKESN